MTPLSMQHIAKEKTQDQLQHLTSFPGDVDLLEATVQQIQRHLRRGKFTSVQLVKEYLVYRSV